MAKIVEKIQNDGTTLAIVWSEDGGEFQFNNFIISELDQGDQDKVTDFDGVLEARLGGGETLDKSSAQLTMRTHLSQERVLWYIDGDEAPKFMIVSSINNDEKTKYDAYVALIQTLIDNL